NDMKKGMANWQIKHVPRFIVLSPNGAPARQPRTKSWVNRQQEVKSPEGTIQNPSRIRVIRVIPG
ncbi:MAG: hypothetical protein WD045_06165, partial [Pirellulaceae bacterium]